MKPKKILGIVLVICGVILIAISFYIKSQVREGRGKIARAEKQVEQGSRLFSVTPATEEVGEIFTGAAKEKIRKGKQDVSYYEVLSTWLLIGGIIFIIVGIAIIVMKKKK